MNIPEETEEEYDEFNERDVLFDPNQTNNVYKLNNINNLKSVYSQGDDNLINNDVLKSGRKNNGHRSNYSSRPKTGSKIAIINENNDNTNDDD